MKTFRVLLLLATFGPFAVFAAGPPPPVNLVFDTDIGNDVDDALALGLIHALETRGACRLLAVTLTHPDPLAVRYVDAVNTFYGRGDIPIGVNPDAPKTGTSRFLKLADARDAGGKLVFPHDVDPAKAPRALALLRRTLAAAADGSVVIAQVGFFTNLAALLDAPADDITPLAGRELVQRKVKLLSIMAGVFQTVNGDNHKLEYNVRIAIPAAQHLAENWPTPVVWSGWEIGNAIRFPAQAIERDFGYVARHPVPEAYQLYQPTPHERPCYDPTSVLYAVYPDRGYFALSPPGRVKVESDSFTRFSPKKEGRDRFLIVDREQAARGRELLAALVAQPPQGAIAKP
ncbi:MAG: nucleoside hydrolase [Opitutaceae bacterium]|nr:nucleoside hydrolase [Opitutaceae bacterium]